MSTFKPELLFRLLAIPSAPFREELVLSFLARELTQSGIPHFVDPAGNLVVGVASAGEYRRLLQRKKGPAFLFIAHTDHPGFHGVKWLGRRRLSVKWLGGSPTKHLGGARVWASHSKNRTVFGTLSNPRLNARGTALQTGVVTFSENASEGIPADSVFGGFAFRDFVWRRGDLLYTKAADDLVGAFVILSLALNRRNSSRGNFIGVFTRAEEVGFIGALEHLALGWHRGAKRELVCVSLETSRQLPGAEIGRGPIVRLGDRATVFDPSGVEYLTQLARRTLGKRFQRRIMDGGTCEGTAANAHGIRTLALSVPLGNYHNQSFEGGMDSRGPNGPAPEFVSLKDVRGMLGLCQEILSRPPDWNDVWGARLKAFRSLRRSYRKLMFS